MEDYLLLFHLSNLKSEHIPKLSNFIYLDKSNLKFLQIHHHESY